MYGTDDSQALVQAQMTAELRRARTWLLVVGILMFVVDMIFVFGVNADYLPAEAKRLALGIDTGILLTFVALWWFAKSKPRLCLGLGLVVFWGIHIYAAVVDPTTIKNGIILKILFTV